MTTAITTIGLDLAKTVFQVHGADELSNSVLKKRLRRGQMIRFFAALPACRIGMEACGSAHYWAREVLPMMRLVISLIPTRMVFPFEIVKSRTLRMMRKKGHPLRVILKGQR